MYKYDDDYLRFLENKALAIEKGLKEKNNTMATFASEPMTIEIKSEGYDKFYVELLEEEVEYRGRIIWLSWLGWLVTAILFYYMG